jgi:hypothetical protein
MLQRADKPHELLSDAVRACVSRHPGNTEAAANALFGMVLASSQLREQLTEPLLKQACRTQVGDALRANNQTRWGSRSPGVDRRAGPALVKAVRQYTLMEYTLPIRNGVQMRDATASDLQEAAKMMGKQGRNMLQKERWLLLVCDALGNAERVGDALSEGKLEALEAEAKKLQV